MRIPAKSNKRKGWELEGGAGREPQLGKGEGLGLAPGTLLAPVSGNWRGYCVLNPLSGDAGAQEAPLA
jgi:hypothetical protein